MSAGRINKVELDELIQETLQCMRILDQVEEFGEQCLLWTGTKSADGGYPIMKIKGCGCVTVRRVVVQLDGREAAKRQPVRSSCGERLCVSNKCLLLSNASEIATIAGQEGAYSSVARRSKIAATKRKKSKITMDIARDIRLSDDSGPVLADRYGVNKSVINNIKRGISWKEYGGFFAGLGAR